jgi:hypothetical protein
MLTGQHPVVILRLVRHKLQNTRKRARPPRIRVPNNERGLFTVDDQKFVGVIQRLSITGGSALLSKGPIPHGTLGEMGLKTVFGKVTAQIQFLRTGADGIPLAQAFRFVEMDDMSRKRFNAAVKKMQSAGFSDIEDKGNHVPDLVSQSLTKLRDSIRRISSVMPFGRRARAQS